MSSSSSSSPSISPSNAHISLPVSHVPPLSLAFLSSLLLAASAPPTSVPLPPAARTLIADLLRGASAHSRHYDSTYFLSRAFRMVPPASPSPFPARAPHAKAVSVSQLSLALSASSVDASSPSSDPALRAFLRDCASSERGVKPSHSRPPFDLSRDRDRDAEKENAGMWDGMRDDDSFGPLTHNAAPLEVARSTVVKSLPPSRVSSAADSSTSSSSSSPFLSAREQLVIEYNKKYGAAASNRLERDLGPAPAPGPPPTKASGLRRPAPIGDVGGAKRNKGGGNYAQADMPSMIKRGLDALINGEVDDVPTTGAAKPKGGAAAVKEREKSAKEKEKEAEAALPEELKGCDPKLVEIITNDIMDSSRGVSWDDIAGLEEAKKTVKEVVIWPFQNPQLFQGLRSPAKGILLFGPPGTGKTMIGKAIASEARAKFFSISASSLTSKWHGEGEKLVKTLFAVAAYHQPAIIFIDEIDSLLSQRNEGEFEASRRIKTEFFVQLDGANSIASTARILVVGATNRPQEIDEAARRRLVKRLYIPLPDKLSRLSLIQLLLHDQAHSLTAEHFDALAECTLGYSGSDLHQLCKEAAYEPIRAASSNLQPGRALIDILPNEVRPILYEDFLTALTQIRASVSPRDLQQYVDWNRIYGAKSNEVDETLKLLLEREARMRKLPMGHGDRYVSPVGGGQATDMQGVGTHDD